jgi:hypothetical protein
MARISYCAAIIFDISNVAVSFSRHSVAEDGRGKSAKIEIVAVRATIPSIPEAGSSSG